MTNLAADFWWLSGHEVRHSWLVGVGHHTAPLEDEERPLTPPSAIDPERPTLLSWAHSLNEAGEASGAFQQYPLGFLSYWRTRWDNVNVYRTMKLFGDGGTILGPFLVDIDSQNWAQPSIDELKDTLVIVRHAVDVLLTAWHLQPGIDFRVFFSGQKGFNIEAVPGALNIAGTANQQIRSSADRLDAIIQIIEDRSSLLPSGATIDRIYGNRFGYRLKHPYIRLHDSLNCARSDNVETCRRRIPLTIYETMTLSIEQIVKMSDG